MYFSSHHKIPAAAPILNPDIINPVQPQRSPCLKNQEWALGTPNIRAHKAPCCSLGRNTVRPPHMAGPTASRRLLRLRILVTIATVTMVTMTMMVKTNISKAKTRWHGCNWVVEKTLFSGAFSMIAKQKLLRHCPCRRLKNFFTFTWILNSK